MISDSLAHRPSTLPLPEFWRGHIFGPTNRASVLARLHEDGDVVRLRVLLDDAALGPAACRFTGVPRVNDVECRLLSFIPSGAAFPVAAKLSLHFSEDNQSAAGAWSSDVGTSGSCSLSAITERDMGWWGRMAITYASVLMQSPVYYSAVLFAVIVLSLVRLLHLTYPILVLILIPALFVFRGQMKALIDYFGLTKAGPFEFQLQRPLGGVPDVMTMRAFFRQSINSLGGSLSEAVGVEGIEFLTFDWFFAPLTKLMILWLSQRDAALASEFNEMAAKIGIVQASLGATWAALFITGVASIADDRVSLTDAGQNYARHLMVPKPS